MLLSAILHDADDRKYHNSNKSLTNAKNIL